jgi:DNA-binding MarR family transcriptional regulator
VPSGRKAADVAPAKPIDTTPLDRTVGFLLKRAQIVISREIHRIFAEFDITAVQFSVLTVAANNPGIAQGELAAALEVERPRMVPVLDKLVSRGLTVRREDERDGRSRRIHLTDAGEELLAELQRRFRVLEERVASTLGPDQRDRLLDALEILADLPQMT